jgi:hypothetical protein
MEPSGRLDRNHAPAHSSLAANAHLLFHARRGTVSATGFMLSLLLRDLAANEWRFSLRTLLITMTLVAAGLGTIAWALK